MVNANGGLSGARSMEAAVKRLQKSKMKTGTQAVAWPRLVFAGAGPGCALGRLTGFAAERWELGAAAPHQHELHARLPEDAAPGGRGEGGVSSRSCRAF